MRPWKQRNESLRSAARTKDNLSFLFQYVTQNYGTIMVVFRDRYHLAKLPSDVKGGAKMKPPSPARQTLTTVNSRLAKTLWGSALNSIHFLTLKQMSMQFGFSIAMGDVLFLENNWYVTHTGLIQLARRSRCAGVCVETINEFCEPKAGRFCFRATVYKSRHCRGFVGYGDADPSNVSSLAHGAEMRVAETRAVNRALRKAYGIGICSIEEIGSLATRTQAQRQARKFPPQPANGNYGGPKVRDRLCQIIRQHQLDPNLVKSYATDFCGVKTLREATRKQVENFVAHLADWAEKDRNALLSQLHSYLSAKGSAA